jgi:methionyl-tRNA formyltransferase
MQSLDVDLAITAAFGQILGSKFLATPRRAVINIHPSILPKYRGATPVQSALLDQLPSTGVTILFTVKELDAGPIIAQYPTKIAPHEKAQDLTKRMFALAAEHLIDTLLLLKNPHFDGTPQDQSAVSFCKKILKKDGLISFDRPAQYIIAQYRAYDGWPGIHTFYRNKRVNLTDVLTHPLLLSEISAEAQAAALTDPGQFYLSPTTKQLIVKASGGFIAVKALHPEGGKPQAAADFWNGIKDKNNQQSFSEG